MRGARLLCLLGALAAGCRESGPGEPTVVSVTPDRGPEDLDVSITVRGENLTPRLVTDFKDSTQSRLDSRFTARLGSAALRDVTLHEDGTLTATVPMRLPPGTYALMLVDPLGREAALEGAYRVLASTELDALVTAFQVAPVGPQLAFAPFEVELTAVDSAGQLVSTFTGTVTLADATSTVVPVTAGPFVAGRWQGPVEIRVPARADVLQVSDAAGRSGASNPFDVAPRPAVALAFTTPPRTAAAGACSGAVELALVDEFGAPSAAGADLPLELTASQTVGFGLFQDPACASPLASTVTLAAGEGSARLYFQGTRAGAVTLTAASAGLAEASQAEAVQAGAPEHLAFTSAAQVVSAASCSAPLDLELQDAYGNPAPAPAAAAIALAAAPAAGFQFFSDAACATPVTQLPVASGASGARLHVMGTAAGVVTVTASSGGLTDAVQDVRVNPEGFATKLSFVTPPRAARAGSCSELVTVQTQDSFGNAVAGVGAVQVTLGAAPAAGFTFFLDDTCTSPASTQIITAGNSNRTFYFAGSAAGSITVTASSPGLTSAAQVQLVTSADPARLAFSTPPRTVASGACSAALTVQLQDALGNPAADVAPRAVDVSLAPAGGGSLYSDATCATAVSTANLAAGASSLSVYLRGGTAGPLTVTAQSAGLTPASQGQTVVAATPTRLAIPTAPQTVAAGACSGALRVELRDASGNLATAGAATTVALAAAPATGFGFFSNAACTAALTTTSIAAGGSFASVFFRGTAPGSVNVTASSGALTPASQAQTVTAAAPDRLAFTTPARTVVAGACSAALSFQTRDPYGNASAPAAATTVSFAAAPAAGVTFYADAACATPAASASVGPGTSAGTLYLRASTSGALTVTLSAAGLTSASQAQTVTAAPPDRLAFVTSAQSVTVGACSALATLQSRDPFGNAAPVGAGTAVALVAAPATGFTFYSDAACATAVTSATLAAGTSSTGFYFRGTSPGTVTVTASATGLTAASQAQTLTPAAAPSQLAFTTASLALTAGSCSAQVTVETRDSFGNPQNVGAATAVGLAAAPAAGFAFYSDAACGTAITSVTVAAGTRTAGFYVRGTAAGAVTVTASAPSLSSATQGHTVAAAAPSQLVFTSAAKTVASGACSGALTFQSRDPYGNPANVTASTAAALAGAPAAGVTFYSDAACATAAGSITLAAGSQSGSFAFRATAAGALTVTATATGLTPASQAQTVTAGAPTQLVFTTPARTVIAGACSAVLTVQRRDAAGNAATGAAATVTLTAAPSAGFAFYSDAACTTASTSVALAAGASSGSFYVRGTTAGARTLTAASAGLTSATQTATVNAAPPDRLVVTTPARTELAGACSNLVTLQANDPFGNASAVPSAVTVTIAAAPSAGVSLWQSAAGCGTALGTATIAAGASQLSFRFTATAVGSLAFTFSAPGYTGASQTETINPAATSRFTWDVIPSPQALGFAFPVTVRARDTYGNPTPAFVGTATLTLAPAGTVACTTSCTSASVTSAFTAGVWTGSVTLGAVSGTARTLTATSGALNGTSNPFDVDGPPARSPPVSRHTYSPPMLIVGGSVLFDATPSTDWQTPTANLQVSWDFSGANAAPPPWSPWTTTKTASNVYGSTGTSPNIYKVRLAVRDTDGDIGYGSGYVVSLSAGTPLCIVNTSSDVDDGASGCGGPYGTDGRLSLREALRIANAGSGSFDYITFSGPMTISGSGTTTINSPLAIVASPGVILDTRSLDIIANTGGTPVYLVGLEFTGQTTPITVRAGQQLVMENTYLHDMAGLLVRGRAQLLRVRMQACTNHCVRVDDPTATALQVSYSDFRASAPFDGINLNQCDGATTVLDAYSNVFATLGTGVREVCTGRMQLRNNTFHANATGLSLGGGANHVVRNNLFTKHTTSAASCGAATFTSRDYHLLFSNAANGCVGADPNTLIVDPQYVFEAGADYRLRQSSPARDSAVDLGLDVNDSAPANFTGAGVDRGGRETW